MNRVDSLLRQLTLEEKVALLAGASMWTTVPVQRSLEGVPDGIPALKVTDGPNGARGGIFEGGTKAACFPVGIALAATWNTALIEEVGRALGQEVKTKGAQVLLAPTVNIHRSPLNGRNFECYSEDPYLTARIAVAYIRGLQEEGVGATIKHYVMNESEYQRQSMSSEVTERPLREIYLPPFKAATQEAGSWCVMSSYNRINGTYASENAYTLTEILRKDWGYQGLVMSDWFGTQSTAASVNAGQDLEMPGPAQWRGEKLVQAVRNGFVSENAVDASARRVLELLEKAGRFENPQLEPEQAVDRPEHRALIRRAGAEAAVLLKNEGGVLPLEASALQSVALIGPNCKVARIQGGGSAGVNPHYQVTPYEAITARLGEGVQAGFELGTSIHKMLPPVDPAQMGPEGMRVVFYNNLEATGDPVAEITTDRSVFFWLGEVAPGVNPSQFSGRLTATIKPEVSGVYTFGLSGLCAARLRINGREVAENWTNFRPIMIFMGDEAYEVTGEIELEAGEEYQLDMNFRKSGDPRPFSGLRVGMLPPIPADSIQRAVRLAAESDVALIFAGFSSEWESEGFDRKNMELPGGQDELIARVAEANPRTVVVLNTGSPIDMPWLDKVAAVLQAWYPGQECGNAIADVLFGDANPSGKLPQTFPARLEDNPAYINYPGENGKVHYGEGIYVGYRYYEKKKIAPLFPFGFGLSYTTFEYGPLTVSAPEIGPGDALTAELEVRNSGSRPGQEVVQLYVRDPESRLHRPEKELKAFAKVDLQPGERKTVRFELSRTTLAYFDDLEAAWIAEAGEFELLAGASSQDIRARASFTLKETERLTR
jgi:beta-glucosidase